MKFSFSILFLGWWMTGENWQARGQSYPPQPSISISLTTPIMQGGNVDIHCHSNSTSEKLFDLYKENALLKLEFQGHKRATKVATFQIRNAQVTHGGLYVCIYCLQSRHHFCSIFSNAVKIFITDPGLPKPSIKAFPSQEVASGLNMTIECQGPEKTLNVSLYKSSTLIASQLTEPDSNTTRFSFSMVNVNDTGNYTCQYHHSTRPFVWSPLSGLIKIVVRDTSFRKPTIKLIPQESSALGGSVTLECDGPETELNFSLQQPSNSKAFWLSESIGKTTKFFLAQVRLEDAGSYTCQYHHRRNPFIWSEPSEPVLLVVRALSTAEVSVRLVVAVLVFLAMLLIAIEASYS